MHETFDAEKVNKVQKLIARINARSQTRSIGNWNPSSVTSAVEQQSQGDFSDITKLARKMMTDSDYSAAIERRIQALLRSNIAFEPQTDSHWDVFVSKANERIWRDCIEDEALQRLFRSYLNVGIGLAFAEWKEIHGVWIPHIKVLDTEYLRYDHMKRKFLYQTETVQEEVNPSDGNWIMISKWAPGEVAGYTAQLSNMWLFKQYAVKDWQEANRKHSDSVAIITDNQQGAYSQDNDIDDLRSEIQGQKSERVLYLNGKTISWENENNNYRPEAFHSLIEYVDRKYKVSILGGNLSSESAGTNGNRAASQTHHGIEREYADSDSTMLGTNFKKQLLRYITLFNLGNRARTPDLSWNITSGDDISTRANALKTFTEFLQASQALEGFEVVNMSELASKFGIALKPKE